MPRVDRRREGASSTLDPWQLNKLLSQAVSSDDIEKIVRSHGGTMNSVNCATALHRLARGGGASSAVEQSLCTITASTFEHEAGGVTARSLTSVAWAVGKLRLSDKRLLAALTARAAAQLAADALDAFGIANVAWALATLHTAAMSLLPMTLADKLLLAIGTAREMLSTLGMPSVRIECEGWKLSVEALNIIATAPDGTLTTSYECLRRRVAATTPQISSSVPKRKHADAQPRSEDCARRSSRQRLAPLNFWLGERVIYEPGGSASGPRIAGVLRTS
jgi:hypothetical protein